MKRKTLWSILILILLTFITACGGNDQEGLQIDDIVALPEPRLEAQREDLEYAYFEVEFDDLIPDDLDVSLEQCWNGMGMDSQGRIYIGFTSFRDGGQSEDFVVFRYTPATEEREYLGSFQDVAASFGNLEEGESIPKGHTAFIEVNGVMYMGAQGFHDFKGKIDDLYKFRGGHLFGYDTINEKWIDFSAEMEGGVIIEHQGIVGLNILSEQELLVGIAHPMSDLVLYDYNTNTVKEVIPGIPWKLGNPLSREVIVTPSGNIYTYRGTEDLNHRYRSYNVWKYDAQTGELTETDFAITNGFWIGQATTSDGSMTYVTTASGQMYSFDTATETFTDLGYMLPEDEVLNGRRIQYQYGPTFSPDESKIYYVVSTLEDWYGTGEMYVYDISTGVYSFVTQLPPGIYTSQNLQDDEYVYFAHFGTKQNLWSGRARLIAIDVP